MDRGRLVRWRPGDPVTPLPPAVFGQPITGQQLLELLRSNPLERDHDARLDDC